MIVEMPSTAADLVALRDLVRPFPIVLVTGGAGYIGSHTVLDLLRIGCAVIVVDSLVNSHLETLIRVYHVATREYRRLGREKKSLPPLLFHRVDIRDRRRLMGVFELWQPTDSSTNAVQKDVEVINISDLAEGTAYKVKDYHLDPAVQTGLLKANPAYANKNSIVAVMHFAALKAIGESVTNLIQYYQNNITGLLCLLDCMTTHNVNRLVCSSTAVVHSFGKEAGMGRNPIHHLGGNGLYESLATNPYYRSKRMAEEILYDCCIANPELQVVALRYAAVTGSHPSGLINEDPRQSSTTSLSSGLDSIHVEDVANSHLAALRSIMRPHFIPNHRIYNLGTGQGYWGIDIVKAFAIASESDMHFYVTSSDASETSVSTSARPITRLGWEADFDIQDMCLEIYIFATENPEGYERLRKLSILALRYPAAMRRASIAAKVWQNQPGPMKKSAFLKNIIKQVIMLSSDRTTFDEMCERLNAVGETIKEEFSDARSSQSSEKGDEEGEQLQQLQQRPRPRHHHRSYQSPRNPEWSPLGDEWQEVALPIRTA